MTTFSIPATRAGSRILGIGSYRPERVVTNEEICTYIDSSDEWIRERSGIVERRWAAPEESVSDMAVEAAGKALANAGVAAGEVDMVLVATISHPYATPSAAAGIAERLGSHHAPAVDLSAACAGFCYGLATADSMVRAGTASNVLVIGVEKLSDLTDIHDRGTSFIFADGAGAVVVGPSDEPGIATPVWGTDGAQLDAITMTQSWPEYRATPGPVFPSLVMQGQAVFRWAVRDMAVVARQAIEQAGITVDDLDAFIPHQANNRITDAMIKQLGLPEDIVVARDITTSGNTSAASIPLAMDRLIADGAVKSGDTALLIGFGAGLTYAAQVVRLP